MRPQTRIAHTAPAHVITLRDRPFALSLVELVIVLVLVGIIAAIAVPRFSEATESDHQRAVDRSRFVLQNAVDLYLAEHAEPYFDYDGDGSICSQDIADSLLRHTAGDGASYSGRGLAYGPYLKNLFDNALQGERSGGIAVVTDGSSAADACAVDSGQRRWRHCGWSLDPSDWQIRPAQAAPEALARTSQ